MFLLKQGFFRSRASSNTIDIDKLLAGLKARDCKAVEHELKSNVELSPDQLKLLVEVVESRNIDIGQDHEKTMNTLLALSTEVDSTFEQHAAIAQDASSATDNMLAGLQGRSGTLDKLTTETSAAASAMQTLLDHLKQSDQSLSDLSQYLDSSFGSQEEVAYAAETISTSLESANNATQESAAAVGQIDSSILSVMQNAAEAAEHSGAVKKSAQKGAEAISQTIDGISRIEKSSDDASTAIRELVSKIKDIVSILNVINDVADQTNLLALNAAIIAAQAGEHGRGFAVVADEIKALAERTGKSTSEIAALVKSIQEQSHNAVNAMDVGAGDVKKGVLLARDAEVALLEIVGNAGKSTEMVEEIAKTTIEQSSASRKMRDVMKEVSDTLQNVTLGASEMVRSIRQGNGGGDRIREILQEKQATLGRQKKVSAAVLSQVEHLGTALDTLKSRAKDNNARARAMGPLVLETLTGAQESLSLSKKLNHLLQRVERK